MQELIHFLQVHWQLTTVFAVAAIFLFILEMLKQKTAAAQLNPSQLTRLINHEGAVVVDIRSTLLYNEGHILGAESIPLSDLNENKKLEKHKTKPIVLVCAAGTDSPKAADSLKTKGFQSRILAGGMRAWREADMPVIKG